jgi:hypothetical protein
MGIRYEPEDNPMKYCPLFNTCSAPLCPLDEWLHKRHGIWDENGGCKARRSTRERIAISYPRIRQHFGLLPREIKRDNRRQAWLALPEKVRQDKLAMLAANRALLPKK